MVATRLFAPVAAPPPPKPPQLNLIASSQMPDVATDTFGPGAGPSLTAAGWDMTWLHEERRYAFHRPAGDSALREHHERRNGAIASLTAAITSQDDLTVKQAEEVAGVTPESLPASVFGATAKSRWTGGFGYAPENQWAGKINDPCSQSSDLPANGNLADVYYVPFLIQVMDECSTWGWSQRDYVGRALRLLDNATPHAIELEFWKGGFAQTIYASLPADVQSVGANAFLVQSGTPSAGGTGIAAADLTPGGGAASITRGIQILEDYLANSGFGGQGMLHVSPQTSPNLLGARRVGPLLLTVMDNIVVPGGGYPTTGATGPIGNTNATPPAGEAWIYATDLVSVRLDEPTITPTTLAEAVDRGGPIGATNTEPNRVRIRAQRFGAATFDGARLAACRVTLAS